MSSSAVLRKLPKQFLATQIDDELILVHGETGAFYSLKDTGLAIWNALDAAPALAEVASDLAKEYAVSYGDCLAAIRQFSDQIVDAGFAEYC